jgi:diamine N-acetyltransferase
MAPNRKEITRASNTRVKLVEIRPKHLDLIIRWRNDPDNVRHFFTKGTLNPKTQRDWYKKYRQDPTDLTFIIMRQPNIPIGMLALYRISDEQKTAEFGRLLIGEKQYRRKGYAYEACRECLFIAFCRLQLREIHLEVYESNREAICLYEKLGFILNREEESPAQRESVVRMSLPRGHFREQHNASTGCFVQPRL